MFFVVFAIVGITRAPFVSMTLAGEEGEFGRSVVMIDQGHLPRGIIARTPHGNEFEIPAGHNLGGYLLPAALLLPAMRVVGFSSLDQRRRMAAWLRVCMAVLYGCALLFALALLNEERRAGGVALLAAFSMPILPVLASVQVNYDGAISTLLVVSALYLDRRGTRTGQLAWHVIAGLVLSFGKIEFALAVLAALGLSHLFQGRLRMALLVVLGFLGGELGWRTIDPTNFTYGLTLVTRYWDMQQAAPAPLLARVITYARTNVGMLWPLYATVGLTLLYLLLRVRRAASLAPVALTLAFILAGYHAVAWRGDGFPRYFGPCFPLAAVLLAELELPAVYGYVAALLLFGISIPSYAKLASSPLHALAKVIHSPHDDLEQARLLEESPRTCVSVTGMDSGIGFYSRTASFACCGAQWDGWLAQHGAHTCRE